MDETEQKERERKKLARQAARTALLQAGFAREDFKIEPLGNEMSVRFSVRVGKERLIQSAESLAHAFHIVLCPHTEGDLFLVVFYHLPSERYPSGLYVEMAVRDHHQVANIQEAEHLAGLYREREIAHEADLIAQRSRADEQRIGQLSLFPEENGEV